MSEKGTLYFFTGLAGAGKTTLGGLFYEHLKKQHPDAVLIDGDQSRAASGHKDYSTESRRAGAYRLFQRCRELTEQGHDVVCCSISMYEDVRAWNRANIEKYILIYIKTSMETLYRRDQKGLYSSGTKQVVGVDLPWDEPQNADIVIENDGDESPAELVERIEQDLFHTAPIGENVKRSCCGELA